MKNTIQLLILLFIAHASRGQSISKQVISSSGQLVNNSMYTINFTAGEAIVGKIETTSVILQGFWAELTNDKTLGVQILDGMEESISVFPNPMLNILQLNFKNQNADNFLINLYDVSGKQIHILKAENQGQLAQFNISHLPQGMYMLVLTNKTTNYNKSFKVLKQ